MRSSPSSAPCGAAAWGSSSSSAPRTRVATCKTPCSRAGGVPARGDDCHPADPLRPSYGNVDPDDDRRGADDAAEDRVGAHDDTNDDDDPVRSAILDRSGGRHFRRHLEKDGDRRRDDRAVEPEREIDLALHRTEAATAMRRLAVVVVAFAFAAPAPATAAPPPVHASAWLVQDARTGEVLPPSHPHAPPPIA